MTTRELCAQEEQYQSELKNKKQKNKKKRGVVPHQIFFINEQVKIMINNVIYFFFQKITLEN